MFTNFINKLTIALAEPLPGEEAHLLMMPAYRKDLIQDKKLNAKQSAVLIILYPESENTINTILIQRPIYEGVHSGQIAFPGGRFEEEDLSLERTALREANEEIGVQTDYLKVLSSLTPIYISPSNFMVTPYIAYANGLNDLVPNQMEVEKILAINVAEIKDEKNVRVKKVMHSSGLRIETPCYEINGYTIWGATAMMLSELNAVLKKMDTISF